MIEAIVAVLMVAFGFFIHRSGKSAGKKEESIDRNAEREGFMQEVADATLEAKRLGHITDRLKGLRDRKRQRGRSI